MWKGINSMEEKNIKQICSSFDENINHMEQLLPIEQSFDLIKREIEIGGKRV